MKQVYEFLSQLSFNNNKEWFDAHKGEYKEIQKIFNTFVEQLINEISLWDNEIKDSKLSVKDCTYRIYKDLRFSKNKLPYKTHMGAYICRGGKKSPYSGYYFHIEPKVSKDNEFLEGNLLAAGLYCPEPKIIRSVRDEISVNGDSLLNAINEAKGYTLDTQTALKKLPRGFESTQAQWQELMKQRDYTLFKMIDNEFLFSSDLLEKISAEFKRTHKFNKLLNMAVDYAINEM